MGGEKATAQVGDVIFILLNQLIVSYVLKEGYKVPIAIRKRAVPLRSPPKWDNSRSLQPSLGV